ncbi:MAG: hypothetical protein CM15mP120_07400 [Pseudomonadota bacterium]|nr:MAG: hypothetical protein CM15mP120_07400 [Pseudomonadota bacterium]
MTKIAFLMDPIASVSVKRLYIGHDRCCAKTRYGSLLLTTRRSVAGQGPGSALTKPLRLADDFCQSLDAGQAGEGWYELGAEQSMALADIDIVMMRKDPPFDMEYIYTTYLLERAEAEGVLVVNRPGALRDCNEKLFATQFPQCCPHSSSVAVWISSRRFTRNMPM